MNAQIKMVNRASLSKADMALLRRNAAAYRKSVDYHLRRVIAHPGRFMLVTTVVDLLGNADAGAILKGPPSPPSVDGLSHLKAAR